MKLPKELSDKREWVLVGPMGPELPGHFHQFPIMAVDGGINWTAKFQVWIGDSDSSNQIPKGPLVIQLPSEKDASDFSCALKFLSAHEGYTIHLWGFSGGRKDHELFVWGEALAFLDDHLESKFILYDNKGKVETHFMGSGHWRFHHQGSFSLGSLRRTRIRLTGGVKYPIKNESWLPALSSWGLSNEGTGEITLENEGSVFIHYPEEN